MLTETSSYTRVNSNEKANVLTVQQLYKSFGENHVLKDFNMQLSVSENLVILGRSGSGKSVLIKCIIGLMQPDRGTIKVFGEDIHALHYDELDKIRARIGFLFQSNALYDSMTVRENLEFPLRRHWIHSTQEEVNKLVMDSLADVGLEDAIEMLPAELSGGMRKRIALARTLILRPEIILYDEPTTGLDPITAREIIALMLKLQKKYNTSSVIISHDMECVRLASDKVIMLIEGKCYAEDTYDQLKKSSDNEVKQFFE